MICFGIEYGTLLDIKDPYAFFECNDVESVRYHLTLKWMVTVYFLQQERTLWYFNFVRNHPQTEGTPIFFKWPFLLR